MSIYAGPATITKVEEKDLHEWQQNKMTAEEALASYLLIFTVKPDSDDFPPCTIEMEISPRSLGGNCAGKTQIDVALERLYQQKLIPEKEALQLACKENWLKRKVNIYQKEDSFVSNRGPNAGQMVSAVKTYFSASNVLPSTEVSKRINGLKAILKKRSPIGTPMVIESEDMPF